MEVGHLNLGAKKLALETRLKEKTEQLRILCLKEAELTGCLPYETPLVPGELLPVPPRRVKTRFTIDTQKITHDHALLDHASQQMARLELEYEVQSKIASATYQLSRDRSTNRSIRRQRKSCHRQMRAKLQEIEEKMHTMSLKKKSSVKPTNAPIPNG